MHVPQPTRGAGYAHVGCADAWLTPFPRKRTSDTDVHAGDVE